MLNSIPPDFHLYRNSDYIYIYVCAQLKKYYQVIFFNHPERKFMQYFLTNSTEVYEWSDKKSKNKQTKVLENHKNTY